MQLIKAYRAGYMVHAAMLLLALLFYKERTVFIDIAFHLFEIARSGSFAIQNYRFVGVATQWLPVAGVKVGTSLNTLMVLYSLAFPLLYFIVYLLCGLLKQHRIGLAYLAVQLLLTTETFYWIQSELPQGMAFLFLTLAVAARAQEAATARARYGWMTAVLLLVPVVAFAHPLLMFAFAFAALFYFFSAAGKKNKVLWSGLLAWYLVAVVVKQLFFKTSYDTSAFGGLKHFVEYFPNYFTQYSHKQFLLHCLGRYVLVPLVLIAVVITYWRQRNWWKLLLVAGFFLGYLLLINISYPENDTAVFYLENMYLPLAVFLALPLLYDVVPKANNNDLPMLLVLAAGLFACGRIYLAHGPYTARLVWLQTYLQQHKGEKLVTSEKYFPEDVLKMRWALPYEFWLLSTTTTGNTVSISVFGKVEDAQWILPSHADFVPTWGFFPYKDLPARYFHFTDTVSTYQYRP